MLATTNSLNLCRFLNMSQTSLELQIQSLPDKPGVYQYFDKDGQILYVGKAKNNAAGRYGNKSTATDIFKDIERTTYIIGYNNINFSIAI